MRLIRLSAFFRFYVRTCNKKFAYLLRVCYLLGDRFLSLLGCICERAGIFQNSVNDGS